MRRYFLLALPLLAAACQSTPAPGTRAATPSAPPAETRPLAGPHWVLVRLADEPVLAARRPDLLFNAAAEPPHCAGFAGCNRFTGTYTRTDAGALAFGPLVATKMACENMAVETRYLAALQATARYRVAGDSLVLLGKAGSAPLATLRAE